MGERLITDPMFGLEEWQKPFVQRWQRDAERADGNLPDAADYDLYYDKPDDIDEE